VTDVIYRTARTTVPYTPCVFSDYLYLRTGQLRSAHEANKVNLGFLSLSKGSLVLLSCRSLCDI
jgi:hypothetical protein